jgi:hypothetical protein
MVMDSQNFFVGKAYKWSTSHEAHQLFLMAPETRSYMRFL